MQYQRYFLKNLTSSQYFFLPFLILALSAGYCFKMEPKGPTRVHKSVGVRTSSPDADVLMGLKATDTARPVSCGLNLSFD